MKKILFYDLVPVYEKDTDEFSFASAALVNCIATGKQLDSMGGPGFALSTEIVDKLNIRKSGYNPKYIIDANLLEDLLSKINQYDCPEPITLAAEKIKQNMS
jgi:hypothetical protein